MSNFPTVFAMRRAAMPSIKSHCQTRTTMSKFGTRSLKGAYKTAGVFKDKDALLTDLVQNAVHVDTRKTGLVALNKPPFLPVRKADDARHSIEELLPSLAEVFGVKELHFVRAPERHSSGILLLATSEACVSRIRRSRNRTMGQGLLPDNYIAVTKSFPRTNGVTETLDVVMTKVGVREPLRPGMTHIEPVIHRTLHGVSRMRNRVLPKISRVQVHSRVLSRSGLGPAALASVQPSSTGSHFVQVYMADLLAPVLGDSLYSYRAKRVMNVMTKVGHDRSPHVPTEELPQWMLDSLGLRAGEEYLIPKHLHLFRMALVGFGGRKCNEDEKDLILYAPPPKYFQRTADALQLRCEVDELRSGDEIVSRPTRVKKSKESEESADEGSESDIVIPNQTGVGLGGRFE